MYIQVNLTQDDNAPSKPNSINRLWERKQF